MKDVTKHPRPQRRGSRYFMRVKVPADLIKHIGQKEIIKALGTSNHKKAVDRLRTASVEVDALFAETRRKPAASSEDAEFRYFTTRPECSL